MSTILVISPHPDDESIGCGGTIRGHVEDGDRVHVIFLSSGEGGGHGMPPEELKALREREAKAAAKVLGYAGLEFWREPDGAVTARPDLVARLRAWIEANAPLVVYVTHPGESHPDHKAAAQLVREAVSGVGADPPDVLMYEIWSPLPQVDEIRDISAVVKVKAKAIRRHRSQVEQIAFDEAILGLNRYRGELLSGPDGEYAEVFQRMAP